MIERLFYSGKALVARHCSRAEPIEDVPNEMRIRDRVDTRMIEVTGRVADQADALHDAPGTHVLRDRERHDLLEPDLLEAEPKRLARRLGGVPVAPVLPGQAPADLDHRAVGDVVGRPQARRSR